MEHKLQVGKAMSVDREIYTESHSVVADIPGLVPARWIIWREHNMMTRGLANW